MSKKQDAVKDKDIRRDWLGRSTGTTKAYGNKVAHPPKAQPNRGGWKKAK